MWSRASSRAATETNALTRYDMLTFEYFYLAQVSVDCLQTIVMAKHYVVTIASTVKLRYAHFAVKCSPNRLTRAQGDVYAIMDSTPTRTKM